MSVYVRKYGNHAALKRILFIHGWAMNCAVWDDVILRMQQLYPEIQFLSVDLPGYGKSAMPAQPYTLETLANSLAHLLVKDTVVIGWSLGGLVALELTARYPSHISQLVLVAATPRFVAAKDWRHGVEPDLFKMFARNLVMDPAGTIKKFMAIQALGSPNAKQDSRRIQQRVEKQGAADHEALQAGLNLLLNEDKRQTLYELSVPVTLIAGKNDTLVKKQALFEVAKSAHVKLFILPQAGHAPFISHPDDFIRILFQVPGLRHGRETNAPAL